MPPLRVALVAPIDLGQRNGGRTHTLELADHLTRRGHDVTLVAYGLEDAPRPYAYVDLPGAKAPRTRPFALSWGLSRLLRRLHRARPFDVVLARHHLGEMTPFTARSLGVPNVSEVNDLSPAEWEVSSRPLRRAMLALQRAKAKRTDRFVVTFHDQGRLAATFGRDPAHFRFVPFAANLDVFRPLPRDASRDALGIPQGDPVLLYLGSFYPWQGVDLLVEAMHGVVREFPRARLLVVGDADAGFGERGRVLREQVARLGLTENVVFRGRVPQEEAARYVAASDVCLIGQRPGRAGYMPMKLFEYLACARPVVGSRIVGVREIVEESGGGLLAQPDDAADFAARILELLRDPAGATRMGERGRATIVARYTWERMAEAIEASLYEAVESRTSKRSAQRSSA